MSLAQCPKLRTSAGPRQSSPFSFAKTKFEDIDLKPHNLTEEIPPFLPFSPPFSDSRVFLPLS